MNEFMDKHKCGKYGKIRRVSREMTSVLKHLLKKEKNFDLKTDDRVC
jgi:hypothetical protein